MISILVSGMGHVLSEREELAKGVRVHVGAVREDEWGLRGGTDPEVTGAERFLGREVAAGGSTRGRGCGGWGSVPWKGKGEGMVEGRRGRRGGLEGEIPHLERV